jgi:hypothetical protein
MLGGIIQGHSHKIFQSYFTLIYRNEYYTNLYNLEREKDSNFYISLLAINFIFLNLNLLYYIKESGVYNPLGHTLYVFAVITINMIISSLNINNNITGYILFTAYTMTQFMFKRYIKVNEMNCYCLFLYVLDFLFIMVLASLKELQSCLLLISNRLILLILSQQYNYTEVNVLWEYKLFMVHVVIIYMIQTYKKIIVYYQSKLQKKKEAFDSMMLKMNIGTLRVKEGKIKCFDGIIKDILVALASTCKPEEVEREVEKLLLTDIYNYFEESYYSFDFNELKRMCSHLQEFVYLGSKSVTINLEKHIDTNLEIWVQYKSEDDLYIVFKHMSEFDFKIVHKKTRAMILSKVAHEFKNPIIAIGELLDQLNIKTKQLRRHSSTYTVYSGLYGDKNNSKRKKLIVYDIKAYLEYLLLLIKDFTHLSKLDKFKLPLTKCNLKEIIFFVQKITACLIRKFNKINSLKFVVDISRRVPKYIYTNEDGLKQILVNLISNAIKYTHNGYISLKVFKEDNFIKFQLDDTGLGFRAGGMDIKELISRDKNKLGLSIIYDLTAKLGKTIDFYSEEGRGTSFWFSLPLEEEIQLSSDNNELSADCNNNDNNGNIERSPEENESLDINSEENSSSKGSSCSKDTRKIDNLILKYTYPSTKVNTIYRLYEFINSYDYFDCSNYSMYIIIVDDEEMARLANIRMICELNNNIQYKNLIIFEADDGIECLYFIYLSYLKGIRISFIISDETMNFLNGSYTLNIINSLVNKHVINNIPFYILTAYEDETTLKTLKESAPKDVYTKPMKKELLQSIFNNFI